MNAPQAPQTAREALILVALGEIDQLLDRTEAVTSGLANGVAKLDAAAAALRTGGTHYADQLHSLTAATKVALAAFIERRTAATTSQAMEAHRKAMQDAATLAFADQLAPAVRDIARQLEHHAKSLAAPIQRTRLLRWGVSFFVAGACLSAGVCWMLVHR